MQVLESKTCKGETISENLFNVPVFSRDTYKVGKILKGSLDSIPYDFIEKSNYWQKSLLEV